MSDMEIHQQLAIAAIQDNPYSCKYDAIQHIFCNRELARRAVPPTATFLSALVQWRGAGVHSSVSLK
jgi:hypothetical protein